MTYGAARSRTTETAMRLTYQRKRLADVVASAKLSRDLSDRERWPREQLARYQQDRLDELVNDAVANSPYYRDQIGPLTGPVDLSRLPTLEKATMMDHFDDLVTDRRLRRDELLAHVEGLTEDSLHLGRYRAVTTSGSSGRKGLFVFDRPEWAAYVSQFLRCNSMFGVRPRLPRLRFAALGGTSPSHVTRRVAQTVDFGLHRMLSLPVTLPLAQLVQELNRFQPQYINSYPSVAVLLAEQQLTGALRISPEIISTSSELRTPQMTARIEEAFGVQPFNVYGTTEGLWATDCHHHAGLHLYEDMTIVENVDEHGHPVADGEPGARLLITNLINRTQPLIRLELSDSVTIDPEPCTCGRTLRRIRTVEGRTDDVLQLPGADGTTVAVHPLQFAVVARDREVIEFQVLQEGPRLRLLVVARGDAPALEMRLQVAVEQRLRELGIPEPAIEVQRQPALARQPGGKLQIVVADRSARQTVAS
jgi:phenylacetate-coenzyme A ligase PaaK-like adenylate-forming protein